MKEKHIKKQKVENILEGYPSEEIINSLSSVELKKALKSFVDNIKQKYKIPNKQISELFSKSIPEEKSLPISIFDNDELSCLETAVKYLKEKFELRFHEIALLLNRNDRTVWATYSSACRKRKGKLIVKESDICIPVSILVDRKLSVLEAIVSYLREKFNLRHSQIAVLLRRDERNIWTVYDRYRKKR